MILNQRKPPFQPVEGVFGPLAPDPVRLLQKGLFPVQADGHVHLARTASAA